MTDGCEMIRQTPASSANAHLPKTIVVFATRSEARACALGRRRDERCRTGRLVLGSTQPPNEGVSRDQRQFHCSAVMIVSPVQSVMCQLERVCAFFARRVLLYSSPPGIRPEWSGSASPLHWPVETRSCKRLLRGRDVQDPCSSPSQTTRLRWHLNI
jgi:hypothetical protein